MNKEDIIKALKTLSNNLNEKGLRGDIYLVGGAALVIAYNAKKETKDVDAVFAPKSEVRKAAVQVAKQLELKDDWLSDAVKGFMSEKKDMSAKTVLDEPGLRVMAASGESLLAMKLLAARREDESDIKFLCNHLDIKSSTEALSILTKYYPEKRILPRSKFLTEELFETHIKQTKVSDDKKNI